MDDTQITVRQQQILDLLSISPLSRAGLELSLVGVSRITVLRDLNSLLAQNLIIKRGTNKSTVYSLKDTHPLLKPVKTRNPAIDVSFSFDIFNNAHQLFTKSELTAQHSSHKDLSTAQKTLSSTIFKKELERFTIELAWKSSAIEGNTYTLLETEALLKNLQTGSGKTKTETQMILNHKTALDYIINNPLEKAQLSLDYVIKIHALLTAQLNVSPHLRSHPVGITGSTYQPPNNIEVIKKAIEQTIQLINQTGYPLEKSLLSVALVSYIQPFEDGNKRTARLIGNALLFAHNYYPISYRAVNELDYKQSLLYFYEQNTLLPFKKVFLEQYQYSLTHYFQT